MRFSALLLTASTLLAQDWLHFQGNVEGHRYSPLKQITKANAGKLKLAWAMQLNRTDKFETSPIVRGGIM
ncbi:MAG: hypothetical protein NTV52_27180, partial [Acidobacteria bacterium]|nr:hypothetical protein [Acidobacteriota bacterium]